MNDSRGASGMRTYDQGWKPEEVAQRYGIVPTTPQRTINWERILKLLATFLATWLFLAWIVGVIGNLIGMRTLP